MKAETQMPGFISASFNCFSIYAHLNDDRLAILKLDLAVATAESEWPQRKDMAPLELSAWQEDVAVPPEWKASVSFMRPVFETVCDVVPARARSVDELIQLPDLLDHLADRSARYLLGTHFNYAQEYKEFRQQFLRYFRTALQDFLCEQAASALKTYRTTAAENLQSAFAHSRDRTEKSASRHAFLDPIMKKKGLNNASRLASEAGINKTSVYDYLDGKRDLSAENLGHLANALGVKPEQLRNR